MISTLRSFGVWIFRLYTVCKTYYTDLSPRSPCFMMISSRWVVRNVQFFTMSTNTPERKSLIVFSELFVYIFLSKPCEPRSNCSFSGSLIWVYTVCIQSTLSAEFAQRVITLKKHCDMYINVTNAIKVTICHIQS